MLLILNDTVFLLSIRNENLCDYLKKPVHQSLSLNLPDYDKPFHLFCHSKGGHMSAVLAQKETKSYQPIAYYSKKLDPVAQGLPPCVMAVTAAAEAVSSGADVVLFHP